MIRFNRTPLAFGGTISEPSQAEVQAAPGLHCASPEDALLYGGDLTRAALSAMQLRNDRAYVLVDVKVHMLMPGMLPAIPGWHTDGAPRGSASYRFSPIGPNPPDILSQEHTVRPPRYHLLVTGQGCLTEFVTTPNVELVVPSVPTTDLYRVIDRQIENMIKYEGRAGRSPLEVKVAPSCQVTEWDWWQLHRGVVATKAEWRYLIRVCETDFLAPHTDLRKVLRTQQQVYVPMNYGW